MVLKKFQAPSWQYNSARLKDNGVVDGCDKKIPGARDLWELHVESKPPGVFKQQSPKDGRNRLAGKIHNSKAKANTINASFNVRALPFCDKSSRQCIEWVICAK